jgi:hypothetical protein
MYTKLTAIVLVAALAAVLITSATLATADDTQAKKKKKNGGGNSQSSAQVNSCSGNAKCSNSASQIQGSGNAVIITTNQ